VWPATITSGPVKVVLDDDRLPTFDELVTRIGRAHSSGSPVAIHCVTRTQAALAVAAFSEAGAVPGDRMEHGSVIGVDLIPALRHLGLIVVTQPGFLHARGDRYLADVASQDVPDLWRLGSLLDAGIPLALSTDAPFGPDDPWSVIGVAASRRTAAGQRIGPAERIAPRRAFALFCGEPERPGRRRVVTCGGPADLVVLAEPLDDSLASGSPTVLATVAAGAVVHRADPG
jgi:predicted amidohydrolase YtcJ